MWRVMHCCWGKTRRIGSHFSISRRDLACASGEGVVAMRLVAVEAHARGGARAIATLLHAVVAAAHNEVAEAAAATLRDALQVLHALSRCWHRTSRPPATRQEALAEVMLPARLPDAST
eukprot:CAMPEP_0177377718 /NCGR_PEP_ID=MMETSP0368-20130122/45927_1 /TAXON_ID=447022 ORGANISM="Scrippsiella hangoei-like, Strain SHHI-4" /NCGR_SAMPLE_ID=MMETSP0368 /ASSEMBLY_ACC=CAM_ASM_000363 /LENGTH=118 /DNA_ID=CAMNT_0018841573 /DNA_START=200 /DNA_END=553 /DNA_ORIENTATION=+